MIQFCKAYRKEPEDISEMEFARSKSGHDKNQIYLIKEDLISFLPKSP